mmetsp:Transcript_9261/g.18873  ORF Transcript_9261/g.18873 Transcript_9261/m.18873 type:complete len:82 (+) Transcript_9261:1165-1410(+)
MEKSAHGLSPARLDGLSWENVGEAHRCMQIRQINDAVARSIMKTDLIVGFCPVTTGEVALRLKKSERDDGMYQERIEGPAY